ncbi:MAG: gamma-glutamyl-gamma-aminobutyrate hydrolase family protein [Eubacteriales bacterium]|nr:gamma-glutamyl-gamma-aminobutyrate hydrolase family protein [Eubacteriales bacterium]
MLPKIGITTMNTKNPNSGALLSTNGWTYTNAVSKGGGLPLLLPAVTDERQLDAMAEACDGFIFSGGVDVTPCCYGEMAHPLVGDTSLSLDRSQIGLMKRVIKARKPFLAICRGHQVLNVACGGTLYQDNSLHGENTARHMIRDDRGDVSHQVSIVPDSALYGMFGGRIWVNSYHHQSIRVLGDGLKITATADDGIIEAVELTDYPYGLGIQWHPEALLVASDDMLPLFTGLIKAAEIH